MAKADQLAEIDGSLLLSYFALTAAEVVAFTFVW
jgi:hypothetical protein